MNRSVFAIGGVRGEWKADFFPKSFASEKISLQMRVLVLSTVLLCFAVISLTLILGAVFKYLIVSD